MELTAQHRASLLNSLVQAQSDLEINKSVMDKQTEPDTHQWFEIKHFLSQQLIGVITKAITDNNIDY